MIVDRYDPINLFELDDTTLIRWAKLIGARTVAALNDRTVELARSLKVTRGRKLRTDG